MKILALETSGLLGSVALLETAGDQVSSVVERPTPADQRTARSLLPTAHALLQQAGWTPRDIELVAVTTGPGSFTGLRIGVVAAKTFAYAVGAKLVGVHTLAAMAEPIAKRTSRLWAILDAQRQELFAACFDPRADDPRSSDAAHPNRLDRPVARQRQARRRPPRPAAGETVLTTAGRGYGTRREDLDSVCCGDGTTRIQALPTRRANQCPGVSA
jgi:tRNA threonylcarbamoyl adenosine modification protein YeaZ